MQQAKERPKLTPCEKCKGKGAYLRLNIKAAKQEMVKCDKCKGTGFEMPKEYTGFKIIHEPGTANWLGWYVKEKRVASMFVLMRMFGKNVKDPDKYLTVAIHNMFTDPKYRNNGYMDSLLSGLKNMKSQLVKFIYTSYEDSTPVGRNFLLKRGFERKEDTLIWRRDGKK